MNVILQIRPTEEYKRITYNAVLVFQLKCKVSVARLYLHKMLSPKSFFSMRESVGLMGFFISFTVFFPFKHLKSFIIYICLVSFHWN